MTNYGGAIVEETPHSIRCLRAVEAFVGGRDKLAKNLGVSRGAIDRWIRVGSVAANKAIKLSALSDHRYKVEDFLEVE